jgi:hypothetical protein
MPAAQKKTAVKDKSITAVLSVNQIFFLKCSFWPPKVLFKTKKQPVF